ncbi:FAD-dependent oxidoreductase [Microbacterium sp. zg.Y625]|uniref:FAD-dependent oxidoreductase n=1 Tax=Microbacterium jiangjiandongii TaxID=3049071 RepID=UPI00214CCD70|nr:MULTISPECIES: FAD-dependent oxidoreductase [unclassified Microbacterium]MCR2793634.1 FAD-dependent oxidoreductase [Microbacterium sp. zg.Y625]WIM25983.1 FAD-dependent oxidoreductase [Microbacterium sp. zg-Y625]
MTALWKQDPRPVPTHPFERGAHHDVVIVGAGLTGLSTGVMLARDGFDVAVIDAGDIASGASGSNTGKVSLLQGSTLSTIRAHHPASLVHAYVEANRAGQEWILAFADAAGVPRTTHTAYSYAQSAAGVETVDAEHDAAREAGLPTRIVTADEVAGLPFPVARAVALDDQTALDPEDLTRALAAAFVAAGGTLHTGARVMGMSVLPRPEVRTSLGEMTAGQVVLATGIPIVDRGLTFAKVTGSRSYCVSFDTPGPVPEGLYLSVDGPTRSVRPVAEHGSRLIVGGNGHPVGRADSERRLVEDLVAWTHQYFPGAEPTHRWSAQDYTSHNRVPFVGVLPRGLGRVRFATGYAKWGLTNAPWAALRLAAEIRGQAREELPQWMAQIGTRLTMPGDLGRGIVENAKVAGAAARGWVGAERTSVPVPRPAEGEGVVAERRGRPVGISTVGGVTRAVSAVCSHLGGVVAWNDAERTWDCPLHASRFAPDGTRLEGPARTDLPCLAQRSDV